MSCYNLPILLSAILATGCAPIASDNPRMPMTTNASTMSEIDEQHVIHDVRRLFFIYPIGTMNLRFDGETERLVIPIFRSPEDRRMLLIAWQQFTDSWPYDPPIALYCDCLGHFVDGPNGKEFHISEYRFFYDLRGRPWSELTSVDGPYPAAD